MGGAGGTHGSDKKCIQFLVGKRKGNSHSGDLGVFEKIILK